VSCLTGQCVCVCVCVCTDRPAGICLDSMGRDHSCPPLPESTGPQTSLPTCLLSGCLRICHTFEILYFLTASPQQLWLQLDKHAKDILNMPGWEGMRRKNKRWNSKMNREPDRIDFAIPRKPREKKILCLASSIFQFWHLFISLKTNYHISVSHV